MKPFSLFGKKIPIWIPTSLVIVGLVGVGVYAASKSDDWRTAWLEKQPTDVRLALNDETLLCSNEYYSTRYSSFKYDDENTIEMILEEITEVKEELATWEEKLANYLSLDTDDWTEKMLEDRPEAIKHYKEEIEDLNKKLEQLEEKLKQLEGEVHIESYTPSTRGEIDTSRFINNALGGEGGYPRDTLITFDKESWLKFQVAVQWEFLSNAEKEAYFTEYDRFRPAYKYHTSSQIMYPLIGDYYSLGDSPYFDATLAEKVSESKYGSIYIEEEDTYYIEVPGDYKNSNYKAIDTLEGIQCIEFLKKIPALYGDDISFIRELPAIKYLNVFNPKHAKYLRYLDKLQVLTLPKVDDLSFLNRNFDDGLLSPQLVDLKYLKLDLTNIYDFEYIKTRSTLEYLTLTISDSCDVCYFDEFINDSVEMAKKSIAETLAGIYWPKIKYLKIDGSMDSSFVWLTKFDTLEMLDLDVEHGCRKNIYPGYKVCGDTNYYASGNDPYRYIIFNIPYRAADLLAFQELSLKELDINAKDLKQSDCDVLENTLKNAQVTCRANYAESCPSPGLITGTVLASFTQRKITSFNVIGWQNEIREKRQEQEEDMSDEERRQFNYDMNVLKDKYLSGYNLIIKIGLNGILQGEYKLWGPIYGDADKQSCAVLEGKGSLWLSQKPAAGGCKPNTLFDSIVDRLKEYGKEPLVSGQYCIYSNQDGGGKCTDNFKIDGDIIRSESGSQINYHKISASGNNVIYLNGKNDSDKISYQKASTISSWFYGLIKKRFQPDILTILNKIMEPCCSGGEDICLGFGSIDNYKNGCKIGPEL